MKINSTLFLILLLSISSITVAQPTAGWTQQNYTYDFHTPPNVPRAERYTYDAATNTHKLWVYKTDQPRFANTANRSEMRFRQEWTSGQHQFEADVYVVAGTDESSIVQVFGGSDGHATAFMMWAHDENGGTYKRYNSQTIQTTIYGKWIHVNIIHDADANRVYVYLDNVLKFTHSDWGNGIHYFKCGVYGVTGTKSEAWFRNIKYWVKTGNSTPSVSISSPSNNAVYTVPATVTINATATDTDGSISKVDFYNGTTLLGSDNTSPYSFSWNNVVAGSYAVTARAIDNSGAVTTSSAVNITVNAACTPTAINPYSQVNGGTWSNTANATLNAGGTVKFGPQPTTGGSWKWSGPNNYSATSREITISNIQSNQAGNYVATYTNVGGCNSIATFKVTVNTITPNVAPAVSITTPSNNTSYTAPASVTIEANASDSDGSISKVDFYNGTTLIGSDNTSPYSFTWNNVVAGTYTITAKAADDKGAVTTSTPVSVKVNGTPSNSCSGITQYSENAGYAAGSVVQNSGGKFECKPWPYSGWCNGAAWAYAPGTGAYWSDAWTQTGTCSSAKQSSEVSSAGMNVHPNPSSETITIEWNNINLSEGNYVVINSIGEEVMNGNISGLINISDLEVGIYTIKVECNGEIRRLKFVKK